MTVRRWVGIAWLACSVGCAPGVHTRAGGGVGPLTVHEVAWNPTHADVGQVRAVADAAGVTAVFSDLGATIFASGAVVAVDGSGKDWVGATVLPGADGGARWIVGLSRDGRLYRLKDRSAFEEVSARYGLEGDSVRSVATLGGNRVAFLLAQDLAIADGASVMRYAAAGFSGLVGGGGFGGGLLNGSPYVFRSDDFRARRYDLLGAKRAAFGPDGSLYVATERAIYAALPDGDLSLSYDSQSNRVGQLTASGDAVWFTDGTELGAVQLDHVSETDSQPVSADTVLAPSATSDVWALSQGSLRRFSNAIASPDRLAAWTSNIAPIFARSCAECHQPGGLAGIDLSTAEDWVSERSAIRERVIETRTMPPQGHELSASDRAAIGAWVQRAL
jgi:Cytochrome C oxidase, cbb3-type, subunit III